MPEVAILILAAGRGTRFGMAPKLLAPLDGQPLVRHAAEAALAAHSRPVIAVLGAHGEAVRSALSDLDIAFVDNPDYAEGMSTTLKAGIAALPPGCRAVIVMLGDMPRVGPHEIDGLVAAFRAAEGRVAAVVPVHDGRRGNPVLLNLDILRDPIAGLRGDRGAGPILSGRSDVLEVPGGPGSTLDIDTPDALAALPAR